MKGLGFRRTSGEEPNPRRLKSSGRFPQSVMSWGTMSSAGVGGGCSLCFLKFKVNAALHASIC